ARAAGGDVSGALEALVRAAELDAGNVLAWDNMARLLMATGRLPEAEAAWRAALDAAPREARLHTALGTVAAAQGRLAEAVESLQRAVDLDPNDAQAWAQLGVVLFARQDLGFALDAFRRALGLAPEDVSCRHH